MILGMQPNNKRFILSITLSAMFTGCRYDADKLPQLTELDSKAEATIQRWLTSDPCDLDLNGLTVLTPEQADMIGQWRPRPEETPFWDWLSVWIYTKPKPIRDVLWKLTPSGPSKCETPNLYLNGLTELSVDVAKGLSSWEGSQLEINGVSHLDAKTAEALVLHANNTALHLNGLTSIDDDTAKALAQYSGAILFLPSVRSLTTEQLTYFTSWTGGALSLGLESLSVDQANIVQQWQVPTVAFPHLKDISDDAVLALLDKSEGHYMLGARDVITPSQANLLNHWVLSAGIDRSVTINIRPDNWLHSTAICDDENTFDHVYCSDLKAEDAMEDLTFLLYALEWL